MFGKRWGEREKDDGNNCVADELALGYEYNIKTELWIFAINVGWCWN